METADLDRCQPEDFHRRDLWKRERAAISEEEAREAAMAGESDDPIQLRIPAPFDRRFARIAFDAGNAPRDPDGAVALRGSVAFGDRLLTAASGRSYRVGAGFAILLIEEAECDYAPNVSLEQKLQEGRFKETRAYKATRACSAGAKAGGKAGAQGLDGGAQAQAAASAQASHALSRETVHEVHRLRYVAGGWEFGDVAHGDRLSAEGVLKGLFLDGIWGSLRPQAGAQTYGAQVRLVLPKGGLRVVSHDETLTERLGDGLRGGDARRRGDAFDLLKDRVAGWAAESALEAAEAGGCYDAARQELTLAHGAVAVDLRRLPQGGEASRLASQGAPPALADAREPVAARRGASRRKAAKP